MANQEKIWALLAHLGAPSIVPKDDACLSFDDRVWEYLLDEAQKTGLNMIVLDVNGGMQYKLHPELSLKNAWSRERIHTEVQLCKEKGIALIPKLNFSTSHDNWLGEYAHMIATDTYYKVVKDLIEEVYEAFEQPQYFHLGMDEESWQYQQSRQFVCFRQGELFWHDLRYLMDCVIGLGARPWIWSNPLFEHPEEYKAHIGPMEAILSPYYYNAFRPEHYTPINARAATQVYYNEGIYKDRGFHYVEEDPFLVHFREVALPLLKEGYEYVPCASVYNRCDYNHRDLMEYFKLNAPDNQILGYISAPWLSTIPKEQNMQFFEETFRFMKEAMDAFYPD